MAASGKKQANKRGATKATKRVARVSAKKRGAKTTPKRAIKRTIKKRKANGPAARIKSVKPTAEHPLPEPVATFTF